MKIFIVYANPEPASFQGAMCRAAVGALREAGHEVVLSDLYAMGWKAVADRHDFDGIAADQPVKYGLEQGRAHKEQRLDPAITAEVDKLLWADVVIFQFPLWWFGMPAILKGWVDRVFVYGAIYGGRNRFDRGFLSGKRGMVAMSAGAMVDVYGERGINGPIDHLLFPIEHGLFYYVGMETIPAWTVFGVDLKSYTPEDGARELDRYRAHLRALPDTPSVSFYSTDSYDEHFSLKPGLGEGRSGFDLHRVT